MLRPSATSAYDAALDHHPAEVGGGGRDERRLDHRQGVGQHHANADHDEAAHTGSQEGRKLDLEWTSQPARRAARRRAAVLMRVPAALFGGGAEREAKNVVGCSCPCLPEGLAEDAGRPDQQDQRPAART